MTSSGDDSFGLRQLYEQVNGGPGTAAVEPAAVALGALAAEFARSSVRVNLALRGTGVTWQGRAAQAAGEELARIADWADTGGQHARAGGGHVQAYADSFAELRAKVAAPAPVPQMNAWQAVWGVMSDHHHALRHNQDAATVAYQALAVHEQNTERAISAFPDTSPLDAPGKPTDGGAARRGPTGLEGNGSAGTGPAVGGGPVGSDGPAGSGGPARAGAETTGAGDADAGASRGGATTGVDGPAAGGPGSRGAVGGGPGGAAPTTGAAGAGPAGAPTGPYRPHAAGGATPTAGGPPVAPPPMSWGRTGPDGVGTVPPSTGRGPGRTAGPGAVSRGDLLPRGGEPPRPSPAGAEPHPAGGGRPASGTGGAPMVGGAGAGAPGDRQHRNQHYLPDDEPFVVEFDGLAPPVLGVDPDDRL